VAREKSPIASRMVPSIGSPPGGGSSHEIALDPPATERPIVSAMTPTELPAVVAEHLAAVNAFDVDAIVATFADDAYVNDARREIVGIDAIRRWVEEEMVGDHVTMDVREVLDHHGDTIVRARYDGDYDKTNLPDELIMSNYFGVRDGRIVSLAVIRNQPSPF
jgi:hypothetical protein